MEEEEVEVEEKELEPDFMPEKGKSSLKNATIKKKQMSTMLLARMKRS